MAGVNPLGAKPVPPTRDPHTPGYVTAKELPDGTNVPADADGNFIIGPTHKPAPGMTVQEGVPQGTVYKFTMSSADSKIYPGVAREAHTFGTVDPTDPTKLVVTTSHPAPYLRRVAVYVPKQYVTGTVAPFIVGADGPDWALFTALDNLIAQHRVPVMIAISIGTAQLSFRPDGRCGKAFERRGIQRLLNVVHEKDLTAHFHQGCDAFCQFLLALGLRPHRSKTQYRNNGGRN